MTSRIKGDSLTLDSQALPASGIEGEVRLDSSDDTLKTYKNGQWSPLGSGGGGGGFTWDEPDGESPVVENENGQDVYVFESGSSNKLVLFIKVPATKLTGVQSNLTLGYYSAGVASTALLETVTTLIASGDAIDTTAKQHTSTTSAQTLDAPANKFRPITLDLSDGSGEIAATQVQPGDLIKIELSRGTDTSPEDIKFVPNATEVSL